MSSEREVERQRSMVNWVGNNCSSLIAFLFKGLKFKEFNGLRVNGQRSIVNGQLGWE